MRRRPSADPLSAKSPEVTEEARREWEESKRARRQQRDCSAAVSRPAETQTNQPRQGEKEQRETQDSHESQAPRPPNWRPLPRSEAVARAPRRRPSSSHGGLDERPRKLLKPTPSVTPSEEPVPSVVSLSSGDSVDGDNGDGDNGDDLDCPSQRALDALRSARLVVELHKNPDLDPAAYRSDHNNTQSSGQSSQSIAELEDLDERTFFASQLSRGTIQDSQEPSGQTWSVDHHNDNILVPNTSPIFLTQLPIKLALDIPASSRTELQESPVKSAIAETPSCPKHDSKDKDLIHEAGFHVDSQDAQVIHTNLLVSRVEAFTDSYNSVQSLCRDELIEFSKEHSPTSPHSSQRPYALSVMEQQAADRLSSPVRRGSAVDELTEILNLDADMVEAPASDHQRQPAEDDVTAAELASTGVEDILGQPELEQLPRHLTQQAQPHTSPDHLANSEFETAESVPSGRYQSSAPDALQSIVSQGLAVPAAPAAQDATLGSFHDVPEPSTISLADISHPSDTEVAVLPLTVPLVPTGDSSGENFEGHNLSRPGGGLLQQQQKYSDNSSSESFQVSMDWRHDVTLPFHARSRPMYDGVLLASREDAQAFSSVFTVEEYAEPEASIVHRIDQLFGQLFDVCDYPDDVVGNATLEGLSSSDLIKHCCNLNAKFSFVYELLLGITKETRVLIVARSPSLLVLLYRLTEALNIACVSEHAGNSQDRFPQSVVRVRLALPGDDVNADDFDAVIGYDHLFGSSAVGQRLESEVLDSRPPLLLKLVTMHSLEHILLHIPHDITYLERKNALLSGIVRARELVANPPHGYREPDELASLFLDYFNGIDDAITYEPVPLPEEVLDVFVNSQSRSQAPTSDSKSTGDSKKRKLVSTA